MSLESKIEALTVAVAALTAALQAGAPAAPVQAPIVPAAAPVAPPAPAAPVLTAPPSMMPPPPVPAAAPPAAPAGVPFSDSTGLVAWATEQFHRLEGLGQGKGNQITALITSWGVSDINAVPPQGYQAFYEAVSALS